LDETMRVLATTGDGTATPVEAPMPVPRSWEVLVRVEAATINYVDRFITSGAVHQLGLITHVGAVESAGPDVRTVSIGDRVAGALRVLVRVFSQWLGKTRPDVLLPPVAGRAQHIDRDPGHHGRQERLGRGR
jgi:NADPH:quinone reductase-like Zn-dependent oxidoreductase